jgi:hypothetical protein
MSSLVRVGPPSFLPLLRGGKSGHVLPVLITYCSDFLGALAASSRPSRPPNISLTSALPLPDSPPICFR